MRNIVMHSLDMQKGRPHRTALILSLSGAPGSRRFVALTWGRR